LDVCPARNPLILQIFQDGILAAVEGNFRAGARAVHTSFELNSNADLDEEVRNQLEIAWKDTT
jgi:hypothetical protein